MKEGKKLFRLTWPIFIEQTLFMLIGSMDVFMLGKYSDYAVGAVGVVNQIMFMFQVMFGIITAGTSILCAQYIGAGRDRKDIDRLVCVSLILNGTFGVLFSAVILFFNRQLLGIMNVADEMYSHAADYMKIVGGFLFVQAVSSTLTAVLRSHGKTRECMYATMLMNVINMGLNYMLIYGKFGCPGMGAGGAAIATVISKTVCMVLLSCLLLGKVLPGISLRCLKPFPRDILKSVLAFGAPAAGEQISYNFAKTVITIFLTNIGAAAVTTYSYLNTITGFVYLFAVVAGQGTAIMVGWYVGENKKKEAYRLCMLSLRIAFGVTMAITAVLALTGKLILGFFTDNPQIIMLGGTIFLLEFIMEAGRSTNLVLVNALRAAGDVKFPFYTGVVSMWLAGALLAYLLGIRAGLGLAGVWIALGIDECIRAVCMYLRWKSLKWQRCHSVGIQVNKPAKA